MVHTADIYAQRFSKSDRNNRLKYWQILASRIFQRYIPPHGTVVDIGAGTGEFLRSIRAAKKIAIDPGSPASLRREGIIVKQVPFASIKSLKGQADAVMLSNVLEHLASPAELLAMLRAIRPMLKPRGYLFIVQPLLEYAGPAFWDYIDHTLPVTHGRLTEALALTGFSVFADIPRFLPYTTKSSLPKSPLLLEIYLTVPWFLRPFAGQCLIIASPHPTTKRI